ncbi:MAG: ATP-binding protein, partial [Gammaproteobacteria bacterium]|nr:ATP-binding protein [Gammaproteobacteria bacterium]
TDRFGVVESVNPAIEKALGYSPDELLGKNVKTIMGDLNSRVHDDYVERYLKTGKKAIIGIGREVQAQHKNGNLIPIELGLTEVKSGDNHKFVGIMRDVTERKAFERELVFAKNAAQRGENAKTEFLTIMGHELRTPMNGIIGMLSLLKESKLQTVETDYVNHAYTAATNLMTILNDILDYIKTDSKNFELDEIEFDLRRLVEEIIDHYSVSAMNKSVELRHMVSGKVPTRLLGDPARLRQVLTQLVDNGIKYTEKGEVVIFVDVSSVNNRRVDIKIDVTDTGIGIDEKEMGGMFQLFSQGNSGIDRSRGGIGIGLAICKKFTALMHGKITVKSKLGEGSTFSLDLPFRMSDVIDSTSTEEVSTKGHRALVVSKEDQSVVHLRGQLAAMQMTSVGVGSLTQVVDGLKLGVEESRKFSVIVIDLDIEEYVSWVQSSTIVAAAVDDVPVILLSTSGQRGDAQKARDNGAWGYLSKPYDRAELSTCIKLVLQQKKDSTKRNLITRYSIAESRQSDAISILLAENDRKKRTEVTRFLQSQGYKVDVVEDGAELMEAVEKQVYNVIVVDTHLPVINGFESTIQIRALEKSNKLSRSLVIAVAPSDQSYIRSRCIGVGVDECLVRPIDIEQLNKVLDKHLKNDAPDTQSDGQAV